MDQLFLSSFFPRLAGMFFVLFSAVMMHATATSEDIVNIKVSGSGGSSTASSKWNCPSSSTSRVRTVQFQSFTVNGNSYDRKLIYQSSLSMYFTESGGQVVQKNFKAADLGMCLVTAGKAGVDAIGFNNSVCSGYTRKTNATMCPCSSGGDTVLFVNKNMQSDTRAILYGKAYNLVTTIVYSDLLAKEVSRETSVATAADCFADPSSLNTLAQYYFVSGSCYSSLAAVDTSYSTSCTGTPVVVFSAVALTLTFFLDRCGTTVTVPYNMFENMKMPSHRGYAFSNYPQPTTATDCGVTFVPGPGASAIIIYFRATLASSGTTCIDELVIYQGSDSSGVEQIRGCNFDTLSGPLLLFGSNAHVVLKLQPVVAGASAPFGSYLLVAAM